MTDDERAIRQVVETWIGASRSGDFATVLTLMTDDVVFMVPGQEPFEQGGIRCGFAKHGQYAIGGHQRILGLHVLGKWAFVRIV